MKISMTVTFEVDVDAWMAEYGQARCEVRGDVKSYFETLLHGSYPATEDLVKIDVK
jgi:hypothetical protein